MKETANRIFECVKGDSAAIQSLAAAVADGDVTRVNDVLVAKGLQLEPAEIEAVMSSANAGGPGANFTYTFTFT